MSRFACHRCDFRPEGEFAHEQLVAHSHGAEHPLCIVCALSLHRDEQQTCETCITATRATLAEIVELYALLPETMTEGAYGQPAAPRNGARGSETPMPGGDALVMLGPGSRGHEVVAAILRGEDVADEERAGDVQSVAWELARWEDDWRLTRGEPAAEGPATVLGAAGYLEVKARWAGNEHPAFDEFAGDLRKLAARLRSVTGHAERPETGAPCFDCGTTLRREWTDAGLADHWRCPVCHRVYEDAEYWLAVRAAMEAS